MYLYICIYISSMKIDFSVYSWLLFLFTLIYRRFSTTKTMTMTLNIVKKDLAIIILKAHTLANFSKFFLLPIVLWRENTTDLGAKLHTTLVIGHHLCSMGFIYLIVTDMNIIAANLSVLSTYLIKEYIMMMVRRYLKSYY